MYWYYHLYPKDSLLHKCSVSIDLTISKVIDN